jgi:hypothetical protein
MSALKDQVPAVDFSAALEASSVSKATPGYLVGASGRIDSTAGSGTYYIQLFNVASLPAEGASSFLVNPLKVQHSINTDSPFDLDLKREYVYASTGIVWCVSSTEFTKTISGAVASVMVLVK